jgi:hypothetical protein
MSVIVIGPNRRSNEPRDGARPFTLGAVLLGAAVVVVVAAVVKYADV